MRGWGWKKVDNDENQGTVGSWCSAVGELSLVMGTGVSGALGVTESTASMTAQT